MRLMQPVMQRYYNDCVIASVATATFQSYNTVFKLVREGRLNPSKVESEEQLLKKMQGVEAKLVQTFHAPGMYLLTAPSLAGTCLHRMVLQVLEAPRGLTYLLHDPFIQLSLEKYRGRMHYERLEDVPKYDRRTLRKVTVAGGLVEWG